MNKREQNRVEKYLVTYPNLRNNETAIERLKAMCVDPSIGHPANANNQRRFRHARKLRDEQVAQLAKEFA